MHFNKSYRILFFLLAAVVIIPLSSFVTQKQQQTQQHAAGLGKDLYGISGHLVGLSTTDLNRSLDDYKALGVQWVRDDFEWPSIQPNNANSYDWTSHDAFVTAANARGIKILGIIDYTPQWELASGCTDMYHCPPKNNNDYANYAAALVSHYAPMGVHYWEIWNEPNGGTFTAANYTAMLKLAYPAIKNADPTAFVLAGSTEPSDTSGTSYSPVDFLTGIYQNGGKPYFDAVSHHPYCYGGTSNSFNCPKTFADWSAWSQMQDTNPSLRSVMTANGDQNKKIWATEFGAPTGGTGTDAHAVTETQQEQMVTDAYTLFNSYSWAGPLFWYTYKDPCTTTTDLECYFGLVHTNYSPKPAYTAYKNVTANISLPTPSPTKTPATPTVQATSSPGNPSGEAMPVGDITGWHQIFTDDFTTEVPVGSFPNAVSNKWDAYPDGWKDTSKNGTYYPSKVISVQNSVMNLYLHTENGIHMVAAPEPKIPGGIGSQGGLLYGRYIIRFKSDPVPGYKTAWLLWPDSEKWPQDGEIDFPEGDLTSTIDAFMHRQNGTSGGDQDAFSTNTTYTSWHTAIIEWSPTKTNFILDGNSIGSSTTRIPNTPMHWVMQTETSLDGSPPSNTAAGNIQIDWVAVYTPSSTTPTQTPFSVTLCPHGLGNCGDNISTKGGNTSPKHTTRNITLTTQNASTNQITSISGSVTYNTTAQNFQGTIGIPNLASGNYLVSVKMDGFLKKQFPGIISVNQTQTNTLPSITVVNDDINNDNQIDVSDYNSLFSCFGSKFMTASCLAPTTNQSTGADLNDDGQVDGGDYNLFLRELSVQAGQ